MKKRVITMKKGVIISDEKGDCSDEDSSFFYSIKQGIKNIWRNKMFSVASIATMCACIFLFGLFYSIVENFQSMVKEAEEGSCSICFL